MSRHWLPLAIVLGTTTLVALTACGSSVSSGTSAPATAAMPAPAALLDQVKSASKSASAVHVKGSVTDSGSTISMDLRLNKDGSASGTLGESGTNIPIIAAKNVYYVQFTAALMKTNGITSTSPTGQLLLNKWVPSTSKMMSGSDMVSGVKPLLDYTTFISGMADQLVGSDAKAGQSGVVNGTSTQLYTLSDGTKADVSTADPHYLMRLVPPASQGAGELDFSNWNQPVAVSAPPAAEIYSGPGA